VTTVRRRRSHLAVIPVALAASFPRLAGFNLIVLATMRSAVLATVICHTLVIVALIPLPAA
jgi:high-affinity K+ transport system ATPase subunit B